VADGRRLVVVGRAEPIALTAKEDLLEALQAAGVPIRTSCGGVATCGLCRVTVVEGAPCLTELKGVEEHHLGNVAPIVGLRLACQARFACEGEVRIAVPPVEDVLERRRRKLERTRAESLAPPPPGRGPRAPRVEWRPRKLGEGAVAGETASEPRAVRAPAPKTEGGKLPRR
jgi:ferredoxin